MDQLWEILDGTSSAGAAFTPISILLSLLLAFVLGQMLAWVYFFTHIGLSYSRTFVQSLVIIAVVVATIMTVIGDNIITAFGLMGALAIIRFRNVIKDTRDIVFVFCSLVIGMAAGSQRYALAVMATLFLSLIIIYLHYTQFGSLRPHNGFLRFTITDRIDSGHPAIAILNRFCRSFTLVSMQEGPDESRIEYAYQLYIRNSKKNEQLLSELGNIKNVENVNLTMQEQLLEV